MIRKLMITAANIGYYYGRVVENKKAGAGDCFCIHAELIGSLSETFYKKFCGLIKPEEGKEDGELFIPEAYNDHTKRISDKTIQEKYGFQDIVKVIYDIIIG